VKTHKLPQIVARQVALGIDKCKCATIAEAEMSAGAGALDVLLAAPLVGPTIGRFLALQAAYPAVQFSALADDGDALAEAGRAAGHAGQTVRFFLDLDVGQGRTGLPPDETARAFYRRMAELPGIVPAGLHVYDGHLHQADAAVRAAACEAGFALVEALRQSLLEEGLPVPLVVAGGTPTFPMHARRPGVECSPGTCVLWDAGYAANLPDLEFETAAVLLTRVISRPGPGRICLDLGHKAVASEMPHPRVIFPALPDAQVVMQNEEHLVLATAAAGDFPVGTVLYGIPWHICPTVALHAFVHVIKGGQVAERWPVTARTRQIRF
jgi:D-serine deaminase-like pyridoxal phosphate-dependent protein